MTNGPGHCSEVVLDAQRSSGLGFLSFGPHVTKRRWVSCTTPSVNGATAVWFVLLYYCVFGPDNLHTPPGLQFTYLKSYTSIAGVDLQSDIFQIRLRVLAWGSRTISLHWFSQPAARHPHMWRGEVLHVCSEHATLHIEVYYITVWLGPRSASGQRVWIWCRPIWKLAPLLGGKPFGWSL